MEWKEVTDLRELSKVKTVSEMLPVNIKENQRSAGRPRLTEEHFRVVEDCLRLDFSIVEACAAAWISQAAYYYYYNKDSDFALRMDRARSFPKQLARAAVMKRIYQWDAKTALRFLELRDKGRYNTMPWVEEEWEAASVSRVQFISVPSNEEWQESWTNHDSQTATSVKSVSDSSASSWESEKLTPWENEEEVLERLNLLSSSSD